MRDNSKYVAIVLAILAIIVIAISFFSKEDKKNENFDPLIVTNASNFYTVNSCLYRVTNYIAEKDLDSLNLIINEEYKKLNKITTKNVLGLFSDVEVGSTFVSEKMYYETITSSLTKYYVKGHIEANKIMDDAPLDNKIYDSVYFVVYLNSSDKLFSIEPYDGKIFKEGAYDEK